MIVDSCRSNDSSVGAYMDVKRRISRYSQLIVLVIWTKGGCQRRKRRGQS